jgi:predicted GNAT family acetyltransferase
LFHYPIKIENKIYTMEITRNDDGKKGSFNASENGINAGEMTYVWAGPEKMIIDHTGVEPEFNGKGVGKKMVLEAVAYAREKHIKILPLCPFAKSVFDRNEDLHDVLA